MKSCNLYHQSLRRIRCSQGYDTLQNSVSRFRFNLRSRPRADMFIYIALFFLFSFTSTYESVSRNFLYSLFSISTCIDKL